jgi:hypothetical protein
MIEINFEEAAEIAASDPQAVFRLRPKADPEAIARFEKLGIAPDSGIVGQYQDDYMAVYYEGNLHGACNLNTLEEKERCAANRLKHRYPTVARTWLPIETTQAVFDIFTPTSGEAWL